MEMKKLFKVIRDYPLMQEWIKRQQTAQNNQKHLSEKSTGEYGMKVLHNSGTQVASQQIYLEIYTLKTWSINS